MKHLAPCVVLAALWLAAAPSCMDEEIEPAPQGGGSEGGAGGQTSTSSGGGGGGAPSDKWPNLGCDPLVPEHCGFPFPSNVQTVADPGTPTGRRVSLLDDFFPPAANGYLPVEKPWNRSDGFSPGSAIVAYLPGASPTGLPNADQVADSVTPSSPTVILDMTTGQLVPHWTDVDRSTPDEIERTLLLHPAVPLVDNTRYVVAIRGVKDGSGADIPPSAAFAALRDGGAFDHPSIDARRPLYAELFAALESAGVGQSDLQLAWDFTTASRENNTGPLLHMRDDALARVGVDGPAYTIDSVVTDLDPANIAYALHGTMEVPLYLDQPDPGAVLLLDAVTGLPTVNTRQPTYSVEWELLIPQSALTTPAKILQYGHGLLGSHTQVESEHFRTFCNTFGYAIFSVKMAGMAEEDEGFIIAQVAGGRTDELSKFTDRLHQGMLNNLMGMRLMATGLDTDPTYGAYLDGTQRFYWGISQGGIFGGTYMALSTDVERGVLEVMGQPYNVLLNRSVDFAPFVAVLNVSFPDGRDQQLFLGLVQMLWDRVEPNGFAKYAVEDKLPGSPADRRVMMRVALGDHQVTTYGAHVMARAMGAKHVDTGLRDVFGLEPTAGPVDEPGATYFEYDFGLPPEPLCNIPLTACEDPHGKLRKLDEARVQIDQFFTTGVAANTCPGGLCAHPELSGCVGGEVTDPCD